MRDADPPPSASERHATGSVNPPPVAPAPEASLTRFSILDLLILTTVVAVTLGAWAFSPGVGVVVTFLMVPVAVRSLLVFKRRAALNLATSIGEKAWLAVVSLFVACMVYLAFAAALFMAFWAACFAMLSAESDVAPIVPWLLGLLVPVILIACLVMVVRWIRRRWRLDTKSAAQQAAWSFQGLWRAAAVNARDARSEGSWRTFGRLFLQTTAVVIALGVFIAAVWGVSIVVRVVAGDVELQLVTVRVLLALVIIVVSLRAVVWRARARRQPDGGSTGAVSDTRRGEDPEERDQGSHEL